MAAGMAAGMAASDRDSSDSFLSAPRHLLTLAA